MTKNKALKWHQITLICKDDEDMKISVDRLLNENLIPEAKLPWLLTMEEAEEREHNMFSSLNRFTNTVEKDALRLKQRMTDAVAATIEMDGRSRSGWIKKVDDTLVRFPRRAWTLYKMSMLNEMTEAEEVEKMVEFTNVKIPIHEVEAKPRRSLRRRLFDLLKVA